MTKDQLDLYAGYVLIAIFIFSEIVLFKIIKRDWSNKKLMLRNYIFAFCMGLGFLLTVLVTISIYLKLTN